MVNVIDWALNLIWTAIPLWVWIVVGGVLLGAAWRTFGWQGVVGGLAALVTLGAYRQGYRDASARKKPAIPVESYQEPIAPPKPRVRTIFDIFRGR